MPSLLSQPDPILDKIQSYLGPRSVTRLESTHPKLQKTVSKSNRYWKDSFVREVAKKNHVHQDHRVLSPNLPALKSAHPNSEPKGYWKARYRDEIHPVRKKKHDRAIAQARQRRIHSDTFIPNLLGSLAIAPSVLTAAGGAALYFSSVTAGIYAGQMTLFSLGLSSPITLPIMGLSASGAAGGLSCMATGLSSVIAMGIPISIGLEGAAQLSEWNFNREQAQTENNFVEHS